MKSLIAVALYPPRITYIAVNTAMPQIHAVYGILNAILKSLERPLYTDAVYGIKNMNTITADAVLSPFESYLFSKNSGIVDALRCFDIFLVLSPSRTHARALPIRAFPTPIHDEAMP